MRLENISLSHYNVEVITPTFEMTLMDIPNNTIYIKQNKSIDSQRMIHNTVVTINRSPAETVRVQK